MYVFFYVYLYLYVSVSIYLSIYLFIYIYIYTYVYILYIVDIVWLTVSEKSVFPTSFGHGRFQVNLFSFEKT